MSCQAATGIDGHRCESFGANRFLHSGSRAASGVDTVRRNLDGTHRSNVGAGVADRRPHGVLLFKAKYLRPKDDADFVVAEAMLTESERAWLVTTLDRAHPGHPWARRLSERDAVDDENRVDREPGDDRAAG